MGVGLICFMVPEDETYVPPVGTGQRLVDELLADGFRRHPFDCFEPGGFNVWLLPPRVDVPIASPIAGDSDVRYRSFRIGVTEDVTPKACINPYGGLRYCRACDALVEDSAMCSACGVEEDAGRWRMGPPQVLFTAALSVSVHFDSNRVSYLGAEPLHVVETGIRLYFEGRLERWEASLGVRLRVVRMAT